MWKTHTYLSTLKFRVYVFGSRGVFTCRTWKACTRKTSRSAPRLAIAEIAYCAWPRAFETGVSIPRGWSRPSEQGEIACMMEQYINVCDTLYGFRTSSGAVITPSMNSLYAMAQRCHQEVIQRYGGGRAGGCTHGGGGGGRGGVLVCFLPESLDHRPNRMGRGGDCITPRSSLACRTTLICLLCCFMWSKHVVGRC